MQEPLKKLKIPQNFISLFASGNSIKQIPPEEIEEIKSKSFMITMNYAPPYLKGHANIFADKKVFTFLQDYYRTNKKECLLIGNRKRFGKTNTEIQEKIDYIFDIRKEGLKGNYTLVWTLQLLQLYFKEKTILLFGVDLYSEEGNKHAKWYDNNTDFDLNHRKETYDVQHKLNQAGEQLIRLIKKDNVYNCNLKSHCGHFPKKKWQEILI